MITISIIFGVLGLALYIIVLVITHRNTKRINIIQEKNDNLQKEFDKQHKLNKTLIHNIEGLNREHNKIERPNYF